MSAELILNESYIKIFFQTEVRAIHLVWNGFSTSKEFRAACEKSLEVLQELKLSKIIADNRAGKAVAPGDQEWLSEDWFPRAINKGLRLSAVVLSESTLNQHASNRISNNVNGGLFLVRNFSELNDALDWLSSEDPY